MRASRSARAKSEDVGCDPTTVTFTSRPRASASSINRERTWPQYSNVPREVKPKNPGTRKTWCVAPKRVRWYLIGADAGALSRSGSHRRALDRVFGGDEPRR